MKLFSNKRAEKEFRNWPEEQQLKSYRKDLVRRGWL